MINKHILFNDGRGIFRKCETFQVKAVKTVFWGNQLMPGNSQILFYSATLEIVEHFDDELT